MGRPFLNKGETFAYFHISGNVPFDMEKLNKQLSGLLKGEESSFKIMLFMPSGPDDLPS